MLLFSSSPGRKNGVYVEYLFQIFVLSHLCLTSHERILAKRVDSRSAASDQGLHCLILIQEFLQHIIIIKTY